MKHKLYSKKLRNSINQLKLRGKIFKMIDYEVMKERLAIKGTHNVDCPYNSPSQMLPVPQIGEVRHFFDDGKMSDSRHYIATIKAVMPYRKASQNLTKVWKEGRWKRSWI